MTPGKEPHAAREPSWVELTVSAVKLSPIPAQEA